jgi:hypothetical protein
MIFGAIRSTLLGEQAKRENANSLVTFIDMANAPMLHPKSQYATLPYQKILVGISCCHNTIGAILHPALLWKACKHCMALAKKVIF